MIRLCIKLLSTGSAMMWEGGRETTGGRERRGEEKGEGGRLQMAVFCDTMGESEGGRDREERGREREQRNSQWERESVCEREREREREQSN